jgi:hypothetical protein
MMKPNWEMTMQEKTVAEKIWKERGNLSEPGIEK